MLSQIRRRVADTIKDYKNTVYNFWALSRYNSGKYEAIPKRLKTFQKYRNVNLGNYPFLFFMIDENNAKCLSIFLKGIKYQKQVIYDEDNPLQINPIQFAYLNNYPETISVLEEQGANIHIRNTLGQNILHICAINNRPGVFDIALQKGVEIDSVDSFSNTPLHYAAKQGQVQMIKYLLEHKARKDLLNVEQKYPIHLAVESQNIEAVKLLEKDMQTLKYPNLHPVHIAARMPSLEVLLALLETNKEFVYKVDKLKMTAMHHAILGNNEPHLKEILLLRPVIDSPDEVGNTALHLAVLEDKVWAVKLLVEAGANLSARNVDKLTPVDCGFHSRSQQVIRYIQTLGRKDIHTEYFSPKY